MHIMMHDFEFGAGEMNRSRVGSDFNRCGNKNNGYDVNNNDVDGEKRAHPIFMFVVANLFSPAG
jgi:hypothetical protein